MDTASTINASPTSTTARNTSVLRAAAIGALAASVVNVALWGVGRVVDASFVVDPALGDLNVEVGVIKVVWTTLVPFAVGAAVLTLAVRRSLRWVRGVMVTAGVLALASAAGPLDGGHDTATGVLLAPMHLTTGAAFVAAAAKVEVRGHG